MSPGPKKRIHQNKYRKDKAGDTTSRHDEGHISCEVNKDGGNLTPDRTSKALDDDDEKAASLNKETAHFKKYNKRKIVSNANRYDEIPDIENEELRGIDYEVALTCSRGVVSQFKFEAEKEWEDESLQIDTSDFISIDCNALAAALDCIPFHKRLGISEDVFMPDMIEEFCANANLQKSSYVPQKTAGGSSLLSYNESTQKSKLPNELNASFIESLTSCLNIKSESTAENKEIGHLDKYAQKKEIDTELDFLLSLSEQSEQNFAPGKVNPAVVQGGSTDINIDDWLDSIVED